MVDAPATNRQAY